MPVNFSKWALTPSGWVLILTNLLPLFGVLFYGWSAGWILILYWLENVILAPINVIKLGSVKGDAATGIPGAGENGSRIFSMLFFLFHYGFFCFVHGVFVMIFAGMKGSFVSGGAESGMMNFGILREMLDSRWFVINLLALVASHVFSLIRNFFGNGEYLKRTISGQMMQPYARIVVLHVALVIGGGITMFLGSPVPVLIILIFGKIVLDLKLHNKEHGFGLVT